MPAKPHRATPPPFSPLLFRCFGLYLERYFRRSFAAVRASRSGPVPPPPAGPAVVYSNHPSWWDPILFMLISSRCHPGREGYGPMEARALEKYRFFRRLGVFGVETDSRRGAATFLRVGKAVLERPRATLWVTAEGRFTDPRRRPVELAPGLAHLVRRSRGILVHPLAVEYPFWGERLPEALVRFGRPFWIEDGAERPVEEWQAELAARLEESQDALAAEAAGRDPAAFTRLLHGRAGVGGVYDAWRRLRAALRGERFVAAHSGDGRDRSKATSAGTRSGDSLHRIGRVGSERPPRSATASAGAGGRARLAEPTTGERQ